jgi:putative transposase
MAKQPSKKTEDSDFIQRAVDVLLAEARIKPTSFLSKKKVPSVRNSRRYSRAERQAILADATQGKTQKNLFEKYGVCRETVARWKRRVAQAEDASKQIPQPSEASVAERPASVEPSESKHKGYHPHWKEVVTLWRSRPGLGPAQIRNQLHRAGIKINVATVRKIMEENGYTPPKTTVKEIETNRYEAVRPLELVHMDFKHFYINRQKVYLLLLQDDFSRFLCGHRMTDSENMKSVIAAFEECINSYGKMQTLMTDAGSAFYSWNGINRFQKLLSQEYGVDHIKAKSPRSNGKIENVNKQIEKEVLNVERYASLQEANDAIRDWLRFYNFERTHMGLPQGMVPADRFLPGWNCGVPAKETSNSKETLSQEVWTEVLKVALSHMKRVA